MWSMSTQAQIALGQSHSMSARAVITSPGFGVRAIGISGGSVVADATSQVRRTATIECDPRLWPANPTDLLAPYGSACQIDYGIVLPNGNTEWVPLGLFSLDETTRTRPYTADGSISVKLVDIAARVADDRLDSPTQTVPNATTVAEIARLVRATVGSNLEVVDLTGSSHIAPQIEIERERWKDGVEKLADSIGAEAYFDQLGRLVIRPQPVLDQVPVWTISTGDRGNLLSQKQTLTRERVYNRVVASGQRSDGTLPVFAAVSDTDPASPTRYNGPFGKKPRFYSSPSLTTVAQCTSAAQAFLDRVRGVAAQVTNEILVNPALDPGDVLLVRDDETGESRHIIDKVTTPLTPGGTQPIETRSDELPAEQ